MPKSKRNKQVDLSKTKKHGLEGKKKLYDEVRTCVETYTHLFVFTVNDMRNSKIKSVREQWKHSRFFIGKNKVMAKALGMQAEDEFRTNLHKIGRRLKGERGLFFSNQSIEEVLKWFSSYSEGDFARSGNRATETVILKEGPLSQFPHNLEPYLRQLGLPTSLKKGVIHLVKDHTVCNVGDVLTPETAKIVKLLGYEMAEFYIKIECVWSQDGSFSDFTTREESKENINKANSSIQVPNDVASMDVDDVETDEVEAAEPSDEMIEDIIMKNRRSLMDNKLKQSEKEISSNESSDDEDPSFFIECKTDIKVTSEEANEYSTDKGEEKISEIKSISEVRGTESSENINSSTVETVSKDSSDKDENNTVQEKIAKITPNNDESEDKDVEFSEIVEEAKITTNNAVSDDENEEIPRLVEDTTTIAYNSESGNDNKSISNSVEETLTAIDEIECTADSVISNGNSLKRLSLDKSVLQSPVMLEKRPKYSPKMLRSAAKAKKTVSKLGTDKVEANDESKQPPRGRSHKRHDTEESPAERTLRNRSVKIVKKKK